MLETPSLLLRELDLRDRHNLFEILSDPETMRYYPKIYSLEESSHWIRRSRESYSENGFGLWAVVLKDKGTFIGQCGISYQNIDGETVPEIGYHIQKAHWNKGFATEASAKSLTYGFETLGMKEIFIHTSHENQPSIRVARKIGMHFRKQYFKSFLDNKIKIPHVVYSKRCNEQI